MEVFQIDNNDNYLIKVKNFDPTVYRMTTTNGEIFEFSGQNIQTTYKMLNTLQRKVVTTVLDGYTNILTKEEISREAYNEQLSQFAPAGYDDDDGEPYWENSEEGAIKQHRYKSFVSSHTQRTSKCDNWFPVDVVIKHLMTETNEPFISPLAVTTGNLDKGAICELNSTGAIYDALNTLQNDLRQRGYRFDVENSTHSGFRYIKVNGSYVFGDNEGSYPNRIGTISELVSYRNKITSEFVNRMTVVALRDQVRPSNELFVDVHQTLSNVFNSVRNIKSMKTTETSRISAMNQLRSIMDKLDLFIFK